MARRCQEGRWEVGDRLRRRSSNPAAGVDAVSGFQKRSIGATDEGVKLRHRTVLPKECTTVKTLIA